MFLINPGSADAVHMGLRWIFSSTINQPKRTQAVEIGLNAVFLHSHDLPSRWDQHGVIHTVVIWADGRSSHCRNKIRICR